MRELWEFLGEWSDCKSYNKRTSEVLDEDDSGGKSVLVKMDKTQVRPKGHSSQVYFHSCWVTSQRPLSQPRAILLKFQTLAKPVKLARSIAISSSFSGGRISAVITWTFLFLLFHHNISSFLLTYQEDWKPIEMNM